MTSTQDVYLNEQQINDEATVDDLLERKKWSEWVSESVSQSVSQWFATATSNLDACSTVLYALHYPSALTLC